MNLDGAIAKLPIRSSEKFRENNDAFKISFFPKIHDRYGQISQNAGDCVLFKVLGINFGIF